MVIMCRVIGHVDRVNVKGEDNAAPNNGMHPTAISGALMR